MSEQDNTRIVQEIFASFGRGDMAAVVGAMAEEVEWWVPGPYPEIPYAGARRGREQVLQFYATVGELVEFEQFEPREFIAEGDTVVVLGHIKARARKTGRPFEHDWAMVFTMSGGQVVRYRDYEDTASLVHAFRGA